ncbi:hemerythrin domain-containing protein [candidate division KSB1 bacterium]|nr:hemerythrin domain-containing protein [candidate division KSB1 bacterium]
MAQNVDIAADLERVHGAITRALEVSVENSAKFINKTPADIELQGFTMFLDCFITFLEGHHEIEDNIAFPFFKDKLPETPYEKLKAEHREMVSILKQIDEANQHLKEAENIGTAARALNKHLTQLQKIWYPHIESEETHLCGECICSVVPQIDQDKLVARFGDHSRQHSKPAQLVLPFVLYNMPPEVRSIFAKGIPWIVTGLLIPYIWKSKWRPMKPYFLPH